MQYIKFDGTILSNKKPHSVRAIASLNTEKVDRGSSKASGTRLNPDLVCATAAALPELKSAIWGFSMPPRCMVAWHQTFRATLAHVVMIHSHSSIRTHHFTIQDKEPHNNEIEPESFFLDGMWLFEMLPLPSDDEEISNEYAPSG